MEDLREVITNLQQQIETLSVRVRELSNARTTINDNDENINNENEDNISEGATNNTIMHEMSNLKANLDLITEFEGNNISVETFIFEIKTVIDEIPEESHNKFIRLIIAKKIVKQARKAIDGHDIRSIDDLNNTLRENFGETKSFDIATLERSQCHQGNDNVISYNKRFNEIHLNVKRAINNNANFDANHRKVSLINEEQQGLVQYIRGLQPSIKLFVKADQPKTLRDAQNSALETEKEEITSKFIHRKPIFEQNKTLAKQRNAQHTPWTSKPPVQNNMIDTKKQFTCHGCGSVDHFIRNCPNKQTNRNFPSKKFPSIPPNQLKYTQCQIEPQTPEQFSQSEWTLQPEEDPTHSSQTQELQ
ncbi:hypothetical protein PV326_009480 [Microctonus aethiopoides]|nr:hypothetical protein PV326_009480 [Microctonus aethiopoides]